MSDNTTILVLGLAALALGGIYMIRKTTVVHLSPPRPQPQPQTYDVPPVTPTEAAPTYWPSPPSQAEAPAPTQAHVATSEPKKAQTQDSGNESFTPVSVAASKDFKFNG